MDNSNSGYTFFDSHQTINYRITDETKEEANNVLKAIHVISQAWDKDIEIEAISDLGSDKSITGLPDLVIATYVLGRVKDPNLIPKAEMDEILSEYHEQDFLYGNCIETIYSDKLFEFMIDATELEFSDPDRIQRGGPGTSSAYWREKSNALHMFIRYILRDDNKQELLRMVAISNEITMEDLLTIECLYDLVEQFIEKAKELKLI